jgi:aldehyde:ferredoxin oxidoreductase
MPKGYTGKILRVNLSNGEISITQYDEAWYRTYLGGWNLIAYVLLTETPAECDPLGPLNKLIIASGIMTGTPVAGSGRNAVGAKSPLTGGFGEADVGGFFGAELRRAGWDGVIVEGAAARPVYLWIKDEQVEIRDAGGIWGTKTDDAERLIRQELGDERVRVCQIGPAGERLVLQSCILNDVTHAAGRCGLGAVMGSKKLRAVACRGTGKVETADAESLRRWARFTADQVKEEGSLPRLAHDHGSDGWLMPLQVAGGLPTRNFREGVFEGAEKIDGLRMTETILVGRDTCYACPVRCKRAVETHDAWGVSARYGGPEYETTAAFGSLCGVDDLPAIAKANELCNAYGLDTISTGVTIAWAMECFERGLLTPADTGGMELRFGDALAMVQTTEQIALRQGFGDLLAHGAYRAAEKIGRGTLQYVVHAKKQEAPMHDPRTKNSLNIGYAISPTGADHVHNCADDGYQTAEGIAGLRCLGVHQPMVFTDLSPAKVRLFKRVANSAYFWNVVGMCANLGMCFDTPTMARIIGAGTGWDFSVFEMQEVGERALAMARVYNYRCGFRAKDDVAPARFSEPMQNGPVEGTYLDPAVMAQALRMYYDMMGWDHETGAPKAWKLHELGLSWLVA